MEEYSNPSRVTSVLVVIGLVSNMSAWMGSSPEDLLIAILLGEMSQLTSEGH